MRPVYLPIYRVRVVTVFFFLSSPAINRKNTPSHRRRTRSSSSGNRAAAARHGRVTALAKLKYEMPPPNTRYVLEPFEYFYTGTPCMCACVCRRIKRDCRDRKRAHERSISRDRRRFFANDRRRRISLVWNGLLYRDRGGGGCLSTAIFYRFSNHEIPRTSVFFSVVRFIYCTSVCKYRLCAPHITVNGLYRTRRGHNGRSLNAIVFPPSEK